MNSVLFLFKLQSCEQRCVCVEVFDINVIKTLIPFEKKMCNVTF